MKLRFYLFKIGLTMGQWSELPGDLLEEIEGRLISSHDKVRVRAVCVSWNSHLPKERIPLPWLLEAFENESNPTHGLYNPLDKKFDQLDSPNLQGKLFKGSCYGWVVIVDDSVGRSSPDIFLINPLTKVKIELPPRYTFPDVIEYNVDRVGKEYTLYDTHSSKGPYLVPSNFVQIDLIVKVVLSSHPASEDCVVVAIYGEYERLAWCKCNGKRWRSLCETLNPFCDLLFYKGRLHALTSFQLLVFEDIGGPNQKVTKIVSVPRDCVHNPKYLVESSGGELLMVTRFFHKNKGLNVIDTLLCQTMAFKVYKLDSCNLCWIWVKNIWDDVLFLGLNSSVSISSHKFPRYKGNCIYFTDDPLTLASKGAKLMNSDMGIFNLEDRSVESFPGFKRVPIFLWPPSVWVYDVE